MSSLLKRTLTSVLLVVVLVGGFILHPLCCAALMSFALAVMMTEFYRMSLGHGTHTAVRLLATCLAVVVFLLLFATKLYKVGLHNLLLAFPLFAVLLAAIVLDKEERIERSIAQDICFPLVYLLPSFMVMLPLLFDHTGAYTPYLFIAVMVLVWMNDVGAYLIGMAFGQRAGSKKLSPTISPKKSVAGLIGGAIFVLAAAVGIYFTGLFTPQLWHWLAAGLLVVVFDTFGDLFESLLKRHYGLKDSGNILIGHGGFLDRFDGALLAIPVVAVFFILTGAI